MQDKNKIIKHGSLNAQKSSARLFAVQAVYEFLSSNKDCESIIIEFKKYRFNQEIDDEVFISPDEETFVTVVRGVLNEIDTLTGLIVSSSNKEDPLETLLQSILLCGAYELLARHTVDSAIIITDYLNVTHAFYDQGEAKLVNAILDRIKGNIRN